jgi:hypothetical protein
MGGFPLPLVRRITGEQNLVESSIAWAYKFGTVTAIGVFLVGFRGWSVMLIALGGWFVVLFLLTTVLFHISPPRRSDA